jgi:UDP-N-acetylmuramoyl-L-alanyl-D-glutamate--2,6-diaminopimelate ligase
LEISGVKTGLIGTIEYKIGNEVVPASHTTPESLELNELLARMVQSGCTSAVMEVSSHALHQYRVAGINFIAAVFTNLTQDHLDYHGTMDEYFKAKKILFEGLQSNAFAIVNLDDKWGKRIPNVTLANVKLYGFDVSSDFFAKDISISMKGVRFTIVYNGEETDVESRLIGRFNVSNILAAFSTCIALGIPKEIVRNAISKAEIVRGRFEQITSPNGWTAVIDYAHTPDALEKALKAIHDVFDSSSRGRIITVFGCGGNRDRTKRPKMAYIATTLSDITIVSSDNPRHEDPDAIIDEVMTGVETGAKVYRETDREQAIYMALDIAKSGDVILIAGKGHEDYQVLGDRKIYFSDRKTVEEFLQAHV